MIELSILIAFAVLFIHTTTTEGHIFEDVANWLDTKLPDWIIKPLYGCPICMSPHWGLGILFLLYLTGRYEFHFAETILILFSAGGINAAIVNLNNSIKDIGQNE
jgi:hypothetical protein